MQMEREHGQVSQSNNAVNSDKMPNLSIRPPSEGLDRCVAALS